MKNLLLILFSFALGFLICGVLLNYIKLEETQSNNIEPVQTIIEPNITKHITFTICKENLIDTLIKLGEKSTEKQPYNLADSVFESKDTVGILYTCTKLKLIPE